MAQEVLVWKQVEKTIYEPVWESLENHPGKHLIFGKNPFNPVSWETIDLPFDLVKNRWRWKNVSSIHCVSMLYQWDYVDSIRVLRKCWNVLRDGGILWLGEAFRDVHLPMGLYSHYTPASLTRIAEREGFSVQREVDTMLVAGRPSDRMFALKCVKHA